ncbi:hypothetical protein K0M31_015266 [Melipona bicolor]|uniref:Uncharacterized protein n=1 Tax=Melipona bicolor TaxID=60889 RepID=A0AA40KFJ2_9HYME|nr:hypothetical protein K0M31_015266 [Melipona bicolor]
MANSSDSENFDEDIASLVTNLESLTKLINKTNGINKKSSNHDDLLRKITKRFDILDQVLEKLRTIMRKLNVAYEEQNRELKRRANNIKTRAYSETVYTDVCTEITDDESIQYTARTTHDAQTRRCYQEPTEQRETIYNEPAKPSEALHTVETLNGINDARMEELIKSVRFARIRVSDAASLLRMILKMDGENSG